MSFIQIADAAAEAANTVAEEQPQQGGWVSMLPFIVIIALMFFFTIRSQKKQQRQYQEMLDKIVKGTKVVLKSGVIGTITEVAEKTYSVEIAPHTVITTLKSGIACLADDEAGKDAVARQ